MVLGLGGVWVVVVRCVCFMCVLGVCVCVVAGVLVARLVGCGAEGTAEPAVIMGLSQILLWGGRCRACGLGGVSRLACRSFEAAPVGHRRTG